MRSVHKTYVCKNSRSELRQSNTAFTAAHKYTPYLAFFQAFFLAFFLAFFQTFFLAPEMPLCPVMVMDAPQRIQQILILFT